MPIDPSPLTTSAPTAEAAPLAPQGLYSYLPRPKPPRIDPDFFTDFREDAGIITHSRTTFPLAFGSAVSGISLGANDFANSMGTTVGSGALSLSQARILAGAAVWYGASFGGEDTAGTLKSGIWDLHQTSLDANESQLGMSLALIGASIWVAYATYRGWPVSTSQSAVGGLMGVGLTAEAIKRNDAGQIGKGVQYGGVGNIAKSWVISPLAGAAGSVLLYSLIARPLYKYTQFNPIAAYLWRAAVVGSGLSVAYSLGRNDTANFIGPLAGGIDAAKRDEHGKIPCTAEVSQWMQVAGGLMILIGMRNFSKSVTSTIGSRILELNTAKAVSAQLATAGVVDYFSEKKVPISTSHTIMGSVFGLALASGERVPWRFAGKIGGAWLVSIPVSALVAGGMYAGSMGVSSIDRSAAPKEDFGANALDLGATALLRGDHYLKGLAQRGVLKAAGEGEGALARLARGGHAVRRVPFVGAGLGLAAYAVKRASGEGMNPALAEGMKIAVQAIPYVGGKMQFADGCYGLMKGKSWWTGLAMTKKEAAVNIVEGGLWMAFDLLSVSGGKRKLRKLLGRLGFGRGDGGDDGAQETKAASAAGPLGARLAEISAAPLPQIRETDATDAAAGPSDAAPVARRGIVARVRDAMSASAKEEQSLEQRRQGVEAAMSALKEAETARVVGAAGMNAISRRVFHAGIETLLAAAEKEALKKVSVEVLSEMLHDRTRRLVRNRRAAREGIQALKASYDEAMRRRNPVVLEKALRQSLIAAGEDRKMVNGMIRAVTKEMPYGFMLLESERGREICKRELTAAGDKAIARYNSWQRYPRMAVKVVTEPLTFEMTLSAAGDGLRALRPRMAPVTAAGGSIFSGWMATLNPLRFLSVR